jgi:hypothetical protein
MVQHRPANIPSKANSRMLKVFEARAPTARVFLFVVPKLAAAVMKPAVSMVLPTHLPAMETAEPDPGRFDV